MPTLPVPSFVETPRLLWREFLAAWLFPLFFFVGALMGEHSSFVREYLWIPAAILFFYAFGRPALLCMRRKVAYVSFVVWGMLAPFIIWATLISAARLLGLLGVDGAA